MSQIFAQDGKVVPVTILRAPANKITQIKTLDNDKYSAVQVGLGKKLAEFRVTDSSIFSKGQEIKVDSFAIGDKVKVTGEMKGRGFAGPIKRYGFHGAPASHGHDHPRAVGAIGGRFPQHVRKGLRMAGRMGGVRTVINLEVIGIDPKKNLIAVKGAVPGARGNMVLIQA